MRRAICWVSGGLVLILAGRVSATLPAGWANQDIGTTGGRAEETGSTWIVSGDGADIWGSEDAFHFVHTRLSGNGEITARVVTRGTGSSTWSKGGVMIRETLAPGSKHALMAITGGDGGGLAFQNRPITGDGHCYSAHGNPAATPPYWVRLKRDGNTITAYSSANGVDWLAQPGGVGVDASPNPVTIPMASSVFVGLFVCSHTAGEIRTYTFDHVTVGGLLTATGPSPAQRGIHPETWARLSWTPGATAAAHDVYFGESYTAVRDGTGGSFRGNQRLTEFTVGLPGGPYPGGLVRGTTYYWRIDEVQADGVTSHRGDVWRFLVSTPRAHSPVPPDGAQFVVTSVTLTWAAGSDALAHRVYFGTDLDAVANGTGGQNQTSAEYPCPVLQPDTTYYWRVDESAGRVIHQGDVWSFTTRPAQLASAAFYYVDAEHSEAADTNPGTEALPFKTINRATSLVNAGDTVLVKAGVYRETVILSRSGTSTTVTGRTGTVTTTLPITIMAYPGHEGRAIINAAEPVIYWRKCTDPAECAGNPHWRHVYVADVAALVQAHPDPWFAVRQVFQHGRLLKRSRYPDTGWRYPKSLGDPGKSFADDALSQPAGYFTGAVCHIKTAVWQIDQIPIADFFRGTVTLSQSPRYAMTTRFGYYITSVVGEINAEGEWAYDPAQQRIYLWPQGEVPESVEFSYRDNCLESHNGTAWNVVRGLTLRHAYRCGIRLNRSDHMQIEDNTIEYAFFVGLSVYTGGTHAGDYNQIVHNTIRHCADYGLSVDSTCAYTNVEGNYIYGAGTDIFGGDLMNGQSWGIVVSGPYTRVYNNRIDRTGYVGMYVFGRTLSRDVSYNYITHSGLALADVGGIYMGGGFSDGPEQDHIHHNIVADTIGCRTMDRWYDLGGLPTPQTYSGEGEGIYADAENNNRVIEYNTVLHCCSRGVYLMWAPGNVVRHNTLYGNGETQVRLRGGNQDRERLIDDVLLDNILFSTAAGQDTLQVSTDYDSIRFGQSDRNYLYHPYNERHILVSYVSDRDGRRITENLTLSEWNLLSGYDRASREFSFLEQRPDLSLTEPRTSRIIYNPTLDVMTVDLKDQTYCDVQGNAVFGVVTLPPFESRILIGLGEPAPEPEPETID